MISGNGGTIFNQSNIGAIDWTNLQFIISATGVDGILQFGFRVDPRAFGLDDIALQPIVPSVIQSAANAHQTINLAFTVTAGANINCNSGQT